MFGANQDLKIVLPRANEKDLDDIPEQVRKEIKFFFANEINEVFDFAIPVVESGEVQASL